MSITISGKDKLIAKLGKMKNPRAREAALYEEAEEIMAEAKALTPVDTGALRASGFVSPPSGGSVELGFGGPATPYAIIVHEDLSAFHPVGQAKYLEQPLAEHFGQVENKLGRAIGKALEGA